MKSLIFNDDSNKDELLVIARKMATHLLARIYPLSPLVSSQTKNEQDALGWIESWARQIIANKLQPSEIDHGLSRIGELMRNRNAPFSLALFIEACRPQASISGQDYESRQRNPCLLIKQDFLQNQGWVNERDKALAKLRKLGYCQTVVKQTGES